MDLHPNHDSAGAPRTLQTIVLWAFFGIAAFFLITEHRAHVLGVLPYVLLLACPILHLLMHRRHRPDRQSEDDHTGRHERSGSCH